MIIHNFIFSDDGVCTHTRGDTAVFQLEVQEDGAVIPEWEATFSVKQYLDDENYLFQVDFDGNTPCIISHATTQDLPYGSYWWDVQVTFMNEGVQQYKTIGAFPFNLKPDVTN
jgi:hypothetical protein